MGKAKRKPKPSMPKWYWMDQDGCWYCKNKNNCNQCKFNRKYVKNMAERNSKVGIRTKIEAKIKLFNIAVKDGERTEMYVSSFFDK